MTRLPVLRCLLAAFAALLFLVADAPGEPTPVLAAVGDIFEFPIPTANSQPYSIVRAWDGNVWFNGSHNKLGRLGPTGITEYPLATPGGVNNLALAIDGTVWFTRANSVAKVSPEGVVTEYPVPVFGYGPGAITAGPDDAMWFTYGNAAKIGRITGGGVVTIQDITTTDAGSFVPITTGADGNLWLAYYASNKIVRLTPALVPTEFLLPTPAAAPVSITSGPDGNLWFTEYTANKIGRITPAGAITEFPLTIGALKPFVITAGTDGALWFTEEGSNMIGRITTSGGITRYPVPTANSQPVGIASCGVLICFTEFAGNKIGVLQNGSSIVVNTLADANPPVTDGLCSLREAITNANNNAATHTDCAAGGFADSISFGVSGTITLSAALPDIADAAGLTIDGSGQAVRVSGNNAVRPLRITAGAVAELRRLQIEKGFTDGDGGGVWNSGALNLVHVSVAESYGSRGGGIFSAGALTVHYSNISQNWARICELTCLGPGDGGGIYSTGSLSIGASTVVDNRAGGGLGHGGGIWNSGAATISNSTVSRNQAGTRLHTLGQGGGIFNSGNFVVTHTTVTNNRVRPDFGPVSGGGIHNEGNLTASNSIIANSGEAGAPAPDCKGPLTAIGPNLIGILTDCTITGTPPIIGDPKLDVLADNGGATQTQALLPGSPAINAGDNSLCSGLDQRGVARPQSAKCDLGAYELPVFLSINDVSSVENSAGTKAFTFSVTRTMAGASDTVHLATANGTATEGSDYVAIADLLVTFTPGETSKPVTVLVNGDTTPEPNETFFVNLSNPTGALIADGQGMGTILDDDTPGAIIIDKVALPSGDPQSFGFTPSYGAPFALTDTAPPHASGPLLMGMHSVAEAVPAGWVQISAVCSDGSPVSAVDLSPGETVTCTFTNVKKGNVTLQNVMVGGTATFSYSGTPNGAININGGTLTEQVAPGSYITTQNTPTGWTLMSVACDDSDSGGVVASGQVSFQVAPGENVTCIVTNTKAAISIDDVSVTEGNSGTKQLTFTVTRSAGLFVHDVAVDYATQDVSASAGSDYVAMNGTLTIPKTSSNGTVSITINGDTEFEINETLKLLLSNPKNAVLTTPFGTGTILNDDAPSNPIGGKNLTITTGSIDLSWETGTTQTGYALLQYNTSTSVPTIINLPGAATSYSDASATNDVVYCYVLAALGPSGVFLGLSDLLCGMAGAESGTVIPQGFSLTLGQSASATMTWAAPVGGADSYLLQRIPLDGSPVTNVPLAGAATSTTQAAVAAGTCFQLVAFKGPAFGTSDVLCGVPGVSTLNAGSAGGGARTASEALGEVEARLAGLGRVRVEELARS